MTNYDSRQFSTEGNGAAVPASQGIRVPFPALMLGMGMLATGAYLPAEAAIAYCAPVDDSYSVQQDSTLAQFNVISNDLNVPGNCLTQILSSPSHGTLGPGGGSNASIFDYTPATGFVGVDSFTYGNNFNGSSGTVTITVTSKNQVVAPQDPIGPLSGQPPLVGIGTQPVVRDLSNGKGPEMTDCLSDQVRALLGADAKYLGQASSGAASFSLAGGRLVTVYPVQASTGIGEGAGLHLRGSNVLNVGVSCGNFNLAPALYSLKDFGSALDGRGLKADISPQGVMTITVGDKILVVRPDYFVTSTGSPGNPGLALGADGLYRLTDSAGNIQILYPAFLDVDALATLAPQALSLFGTTLIQADGTALFVALNGVRYVLTPDLTLTAASVANAGQYTWQDAPNHYVFRSSLLQSQGQGFTVRKLE